MVIYNKVSAGLTPAQFDSQPRGTLARMSSPGYSGGISGASRLLTIAGVLFAASPAIATTSTGNVQETGNKINKVVAVAKYQKKQIPLCQDETTNISMVKAQRYR
ncbi:MAG TPA: hypothetical protein PKE30_13205 [Niabella sp.]|uniref:Uncharacterized protein n=1 Tax=Chitinophaga pollutisoli TaxID=3133966 RepID=A0ABZ2YRE2_9BACT|nr:hypothetical protein [Niabella sp.]